jgi:hypothetical protein
VSKHLRNQRRKRAQLDGVRGSSRGAVAAAAAVDHPPTLDTPDLLWRLALRVRAEEIAGHPTGHRRLLQDALVADRVVLSRRFAKLTEDTRTEDMGVAITSVSRARFKPGLTWWEWDARIAGRLPPAPGEMDCDRAGALIRTASDGRRGTMHVVAGGRDGGQTFAQILPLACNFDWREDYEPPVSMVPAASIAEVRVLVDAVAEPTLAEMEAQPAAIASLTRRFGIVESSYVAEDNAKLMNCGSRPWYEQSPRLLQSLTRDTMQEASFMMVAPIILCTAPIIVTQVLRGARFTSAAWGNRALFDYVVFDVADGEPSMVANGTQGFAP